MDTGAGADIVKFAAGTTDTKATGTNIAGSSSIAGVDSYKLDFGADKLVLTANVATIGDGVTVAAGAVEVDFVGVMNTALSIAGAGFDTDLAGDIAAAIVTFNGTAGSGSLNARSFLAVDLDHSGTFTATDFVIEITGSAFTGFSDSVFI